MLSAIFLIIYLLSFTYLAWQKPRWAIFIILATLPSYLIRFSIGHLPMTLLEAMILAIFTTWMAKKIKLSLNNHKEQANSNFKFQISNFKKDQKSKTLPIILFAIAATISVCISPDKISALGIWKAYFIEPILFLFVLIDIIVIPATKTAGAGFIPAQKEDYAKQYIFIASALGISALYISLFAIYQKFTGAFVPQAFWEQGRVTSIFPYPNAIGLYLAPIVIFLFGAMFTTHVVETRHASSLRKWREWAYAATIIFSLISIILAKSEGAIIALIAGIFIFAFLYNKKSRAIIGIITLLVSITGATIYFKYGKEWDNLFSKTPLFALDNACHTQTIGNAQTTGKSVFPLLGKEEPGEVFCNIYQKLTLQDFSGTLRRQMWQETLAMLKSRPILGAGLANYQNAMAPYHEKAYVEIYLYPHNIILNFWSETGLLGLISLTWIIIIFFYLGLKDFFKSQDVFTLALIVAMAVLLIHGLVDVPYFKNDLAILFWTIWGMIIIL